MKEKIVALIDLGSNSIRLAIYKVHPDGNYEEIKKDKVAARLMNHLTTDAHLNSEGVDIIINTLKQFQQVIDSLRVSEVIGFATAVIRKAVNQEEILSIIKMSTGYSFSVLSEYEEAYYGFLGVIDSIAIKDGMTIDIGGGSTEVTLFHNREMVQYHSFSFGAVSLNNEFTSTKQVSSKQLKKLRAFLFSNFQSLSWITDAKHPVIGIGGTARNLGKMYQAKYSTLEQEMKVEEINSIARELALLSHNERTKVAGLSKKRKDIILPGIETIAAITQITQAPYFHFSKRSLRDGILLGRYRMGDEGTGKSTRFYL
ncbi:Ppx/GppA phosphatase family protein [Bacillus sp. m3-13]|uniref:Ppx/GppA phosphatase family protein n=1 Tax=Bacillus sp. m3-13 TaxID=406124 RepID=UPI0001E89D34|nr:Ppx/GppA phosphatase [Bacillus sp. m3-13]